MRAAGWAAIGLLAICGAGAGRAERGATDEIAECRSIGGAEERLACFDKLAIQLAPPTYSGRLTLTTDLFTIERPTLIRFQSDGPIFVMYLRDASESVVQNLHIGGGGEATYLIDKPGTYSLRINGSESWRVWLEPQP